MPGVLRSSGPVASSVRTRVGKAITPRKRRASQRINVQSEIHPLPASSTVIDSLIPALYTATLLRLFHSFVENQTRSPFSIGRFPASLCLLNASSFRNDRRWVVKIHGIFTEGSISLFRLWTNVCTPRGEKRGGKPLRKDSPAEEKYRGKGTYYENGIFLGPVRGIRAAFNSAFTLASSGRVGEAGRRLRKIFESSETFAVCEIHVKSLRDCIRTRVTRDFFAFDRLFPSSFSSFPPHVYRWSIPELNLCFSTPCTAGNEDDEIRYRLRRYHHALRMKRYFVRVPMVAQWERDISKNG